MALISTINSVYEFLRKPVAAPGFVVLASSGDLATAAPTITTGSGAPSSAEPNGSLYMRSGATDGDDAIYMRVAGAWKAILGETA